MPGNRPRYRGDSGSQQSGPLRVLLHTQGRMKMSTPVRWRGERCRFKANPPKSGHANYW